MDDVTQDGDEGYTVTLVIDRDATADANGDGTIDRLDALLMYYACTFRGVFELENDLGGSVREFLRTPRGAGSPPPANDTGYRTMLDAARRLRNRPLPRAPRPRPRARPLRPPPRPAVPRPTHGVKNPTAHMLRSP